MGFVLERLALILLASVLLVIGKLSSIFLLPEIGFLLALAGLVLCAGGTPLLKVTWLPIVFLLFAIPLPYTVDAGLSLQLQLLSSQLGVDFIRLFGIPVYLEGNVIDLGVYKLQVVDACSGLRYLYPLMSLGFLAAYLFQAPLWQRALVFLSTIPITIAMNSLRIGLVGILVDHFGPQDADGFLHMFEGWIIFIACAGLLAALMYFLARVVSGKAFFDVFHPPEAESALPRKRDPAQFDLALDPRLRGDERLCAVRAARRPVFCCYVQPEQPAPLVSARQEIIPDRKLFVAFPTTLGEWRGPPLLARSTDRAFSRPHRLHPLRLCQGGPAPGQSLRGLLRQPAHGVSPHSPAVCIPGNGWIITDLERTQYTSDDSRVSLPLNRVVIARGKDKQLVYYWFEERGMKIANEYWSKLVLLRDALLENRTDGALVRLTTPVYPGEAEADADNRLQDFTRIAVPSLEPYLPAAASTPLAR